MHQQRSGVMVEWDGCRSVAMIGGGNACINSVVRVMAEWDGVRSVAMVGGGNECINCIVRGNGGVGWG